MDGKNQVIEALGSFSVDQVVGFLGYDISKSDEKYHGLDDLVKKMVAYCKSKQRPLEAASNDRTGEAKSEAYTLRNSPGCVLMMSNSFDSIGQLKSRVGASKADLKMMSELWKSVDDCLLFDINDENSRAFHSVMTSQIGGRSAYENLKAEEMESLITKLAGTNNAYSYVVVYVSSHGGRVPEEWVKRYECTDQSEGSEQLDVEEAYGELEKMCEQKSLGPLVQVFFGEDGRPVREDKILKLFHNFENKKLQGIPKFFILDYCRSAVKFDGAEMTKAVEESQNSTANSKSSDLPLMSDIVVLYATHDDHVAYDNPGGSWLTESLYEVLKSSIKKKDVLDMLTLVNALMKEKCGKGKSLKAMSAFQSSLDKKFYFCKQQDPEETRGASMSASSADPHETLPDVRHQENLQASD